MTDSETRQDEALEAVTVSNERVVSFLIKTSEERRGVELEWFHRSSLARRVRLEDRTQSSVREGREQGGFLRWFDRADSTMRLASSSGPALRALRRCCDIAVRSPARTAAGIPWNDLQVTEEDSDRSRRLPRAADLEQWLRAVAASGPEPAPGGWVEVAVTVERRNTTAGELQERVRCRAWAGWQPHAGSGMSPRPLFAAARSWSELQQLDLTPRWRDRSINRGRPLPWPSDANLVFSKETSAELVRALVASVHRPGVDPGQPVGAGWVVFDRPADPDALYGASRDDAGFETRERTFADGRRILAGWGESGSLRRASFRDLPIPTPACIQVDPPRIDPPKRSIWITELELHPGGPGHWSIRLVGRQFPDGAALEPYWLRVRPQALVRACIGGLGSSHRSHFGLATPALVFDAMLITA